MAWALLQSAAGTPAVNQGTVTATYGSNLTAGSKLIVHAGISSGSNGTAVTSVKLNDTALTALTQAAFIYNNSNQTGVLIYFVDTPSDAVGTKPTVTVTWSTASTANLVVEEWTGLAAGNTTALAIDGTAATATFVGASSYADPAYSSTAANELLFSLLGDNGGPATDTQPTGYTLDTNGVNNNTDANCLPSYKNSTGGAEGTPTWASTGTVTGTAIAVVAFKLPSAAVAQPGYPGWTPPPFEFPPLARQFGPLAPFETPGDFPPPPPPAAPPGTFTPGVFRPALRPPPGLGQIRFRRESTAGPATSGVSQPPVNPASIRDVRRQPKILPRGSVETPWQGSGVSQPPIPPTSVRDTRRPKLPPRGFASPGTNQGVSQPPIPPVSVRDTRRPVRIPPRGSTPQWDQGISQPPIPPQSVHAARRPPRFPRPWAWNPPEAQPIPFAPPSEWGPPQRPRWTIFRARRTVSNAGPATTGVSQPLPVPGQPGQQGRRKPWPRRGSASQPFTPPAAVTPAVEAPQPAMARRRPVRLPRPWAAGPPSAGFTPPAAARAPQAGLLRRVSAAILIRRGAVRPGLEQGISQPPVPPQAVRDARRPPRVFRSAAGWARGVSQPPIPPASVRDVRKPPRVPRSAAGWQQGISQPPPPPQGLTGRRPKLTPPRSRAVAPWAIRGAPVPTPGPRHQAVRRRLSAAATPPTLAPVPPAVPAPRIPRPWQRLGWWRKVRGWLGTPPGPTTTPPLLPSGTVTWQASTAPPRWQAQPVPSGWETVPTPPRWQAGAGTRRWQAHGLPGRWSARLANFAPIAGISLQEVNVSWTSQLRGTSIDPTGQTAGQAQLPVQFAFPVSSGNPAAPAQPVTWYTGSWLTGQTSADYISQCLVGPGGGVVTLTAGQSYDVWVKITGTPEVPAIYAGTQAVY